MPFFIGAAILEIVIGFLKGSTSSPKVFYMFNNLAAGMIQQCYRVLHKPTTMLLYCWIYENYQMYELPWDSAWTWYFTFLAADFAYYWFHRAAHGKMFSII